MKLFEQQMIEMPVVAILRGVETSEAVAISQAIIASGVRLIEVPMNSPDPIESIRAIAGSLGDQLVCGGGTVLTVDQVDAVHGAGGQLIVSPNCNVEVIKRALSLGMIAMPGVATPTEAFAAIRAGAKVIKLFPAAGLGSVYLANLMSVLPADITVLGVGGINPGNMSEFWVSGARGFGIGGDIYRPGDSPEQVAVKAAAVVSAFKKMG